MLNTHILNMFGRSPIRPLQKHMSKSCATVKQLLPFFAAALNENWALANQERDNIVKLEHDADDLKRDIRLHLPKGLFLPVNRSDLLELLIFQDKLANKAKDIAGLVIGRCMLIPREIQSSYEQYLQRCINAAEKAQQAIAELDELMESGFGGNEASIIEKMIAELDIIEHDTDQMQVDIRRQIFALEKSLPAVDIIFLYKMIEWTGEIADHAQTLGGQLLLLLAR